MNLRNSILAILWIAVLSQQCRRNEMPAPDPNDLTNIVYNPEPYVLVEPPFYPKMEIPEDNRLTEAGVELGRRLFYDPILSADSSMSCFSCHFQSMSFTDNLPFSTGIDGVPGTRSSMSLLDIGYVTTGLFWDGRVKTLEEQALIPVEDPIELHTTWTRVIPKLREHDTYPQAFREAFGIENKNEISKELAAKAIAQFERSLVSSGNSKYDRVKRQEAVFTDEEEEGALMFFDEDPFLPDAECGHCHNDPFFTTGEFINNGIEAISDLNDFPDLGRGAITKNLIDNGRFRVPTLRNIEYTAPYMHDGRFQTLEEVVDHYNRGEHLQANLDPLIKPLGLSADQQEAIIAFLKTLSDPDFLSNPDYSNPFE